MKYKPTFISALIVSAGLIVGCSSSSNSPNAGTVDNGTEDAGSMGTDAGTIDLNGDYDVTVSLSEAAMAVPECIETDGTLTVMGTTITGLIENGRLAITGSIASDGTIAGGFALEGGTAFASYNGMLDGADLVGTWSDIVGCAGAWRAEKIAK